VTDNITFGINFNYYILFIFIFILILNVYTNNRTFGRISRLTFIYKTDDEDYVKIHSRTAQYPSLGLCKTRDTWLSPSRHPWEEFSYAAFNAQTLHKYPPLTIAKY